MPKISVIVPVFNTEEFIEDCITSVLSQTYKDIEMILVDDGSTDNTVAKVDSFANKDERVKLFKFDKRQGVGAARNYGIKQAEGEYLYFLDSDDYIPENTLEFLINHIGSHDVICGKIRNTNLSSSFAIIFKGLFNTKTFKEKKSSIINKNSVLNLLIKKEIVDKYKLTFSEETLLYTDLYFMIPLIKNVDTILQLNEAIYFKRKRNDPIKNPSLSQYEDSVKIEAFLKVYNDLKGKYNDSYVSEFLDKHLLNFYRMDIVKHYKNLSNIDSTFETLHDSIIKVNPEIIKGYDLFLKRELKAIKNDKLKRYKRIKGKHDFLRDLRTGFKSKRKFYIFLYNHLFMKMPLKKNLVFFESFLGKNYSDSPKYIYEYMLKNNHNYKFVWSFNENKELPGKSKKVIRFSLKYFYYIARAKYWVSNSRLPLYLNKREDNVYLQTWHGTPLKRLVFDMDEVYSADPKYKQNFYNQSRRWDYLISPNKYSSDIFKRAFKYDGEMLEYGYPRNDILYNWNNESDILYLKKKMNLPSDKKIILYAPTWRDDDYFAKGKYNFEIELDLNMMRNRLGDEYIVVLRMHYFIANKINLDKYKGFAFDYSNYDDIAELYLVSDILITDYSSVFFDYANLKRPILFYTYDLEKYRTQLRGFYLNMEKDLPGPLLETSEEVVNSIENISELNDKYESKYQEFHNSFCQWDDGNASENVVEVILKDN